MPKPDNTKIRILAVERMILRGKRITSAQILRELDLKYDIQVDRKTIYSDIHAINRFVPIEAVLGKGGGFRMVDVIGRCEESIMQMDRTGGKKMENARPCLTCTRVEDPVNCENKHCETWREWFIHRWEEMRNGK